MQKNDQIHAQARARCQQQGRQDITHLFQIAIADQLFVELCIQDLGHNIRDQHTICNGLDADTECCQQKKDAHPFVQKLTFQVKIAAAHRLGCIQVCRDDRPARIPQTEHPEEQHTGQPLLGEDQAHQRFGTERSAHHHRRNNIGTGLDGAAGHVLDLRTVILQ